jgi:hypothetical protein
MVITARLAYLRFRFFRWRRKGSPDARGKERRGIRSQGIRRALAFTGDKKQSRGVHAVAQAGRFGAISEDVAQMSVAKGAFHFGS